MVPRNVSQQKRVQCDDVCRGLGRGGAEGAQVEVRSVVGAGGEVEGRDARLDRRVARSGGRWGLGLAASVQEGEQRVCTFSNPTSRE